MPLTRFASPHLLSPGGEGGAEGPVLPAGEGEEDPGAEAELPGGPGAGLPGPDRPPQVGGQGLPHLPVGGALSVIRETQDRGHDKEWNGE